MPRKAQRAPTTPFIQKLPSAAFPSYGATRIWRLLNRNRTGESDSTVTSPPTATHCAIPPLLDTKVMDTCVDEPWVTTQVRPTAAHGLAGSTLPTIIPIPICGSDAAVPTPDPSLHVAGEVSPVRSGKRSVSGVENLSQISTYPKAASTSSESSSEGPKMLHGLQDAAIASMETRAMLDLMNFVMSAQVRVERPLIKTPGRPTLSRGVSRRVPRGVSRGVARGARCCPVVGSYLTRVSPLVDSR